MSFNVISKEVKFNSRTELIKLPYIATCSKVSFMTKEYLFKIGSPIFCRLSNEQLHTQKSTIATLEISCTLF